MNSDTGQCQVEMFSVDCEIQSPDLSLLNSVVLVGFIGGEERRVSLKYSF